MQQLPLKVSLESTDPFDDFFFETHGGTKADWEVEEDADEVVEDSYQDIDDR